MTENEAKAQGKLFSIIWALIALFASLTFLVITMSYVNSNKSFLNERTIMQTRVQIEYDNYLTGLDINDILTENRDLYFNAIGFYTTITRDNEIAKIVLDAAITKRVPVNLAFALVWQESRFNENAVNENGNGTVDNGLFQINNHYHVDVDPFDLEAASMYAMDYVLEHYEKFYDWEIAAMLYNAGTVANVSDHSLRYMASLTDKEKEYDEQFNSFRRNLNIPSIQN